MAQIKDNAMDPKHQIIKEGLAKIKIYTEDTEKIPSKSMNVFYNPRMKINRSITNLAIETFHKIYHPDNLIFLDSMAASGVGAIRLLKEFDGVKKIIINDINPVAIELIKENLRLNDIDPKEKRIKITRKAANYLMSQLATKSFRNDIEENMRPDIISLDPFGTPNIYLDSAMKAIKNFNGLLCITATDTAVLFGVKKKACLRKYMAMPLNNEFTKELGTRILIYFISRIANINNMGIEPLLSVYHKHFIRIFARTFKDRRKITNSISNSYGYLIHCLKCNYRKVVELRKISEISKTLDSCPNCMNKENLKVAGPFWTNKIHSKSFIKELNLLAEEKPYLKKKTRTILSYIYDETGKPIFYYNIHKLGKVFNLAFVPKMEDIIERIEKRGYIASRTHFDFVSIKTNISLDLLKDILTNLQIRVD
jgi:tRNA (guanine26-N2/guanine27-N2)-dimethyltransferase